MEQFSRTLDKQHYDNAVNIAKKTGAPLPLVNTHDMYNNAFKNPEVLGYDSVQDRLDHLKNT